jgi:hypothetical protein
VDPLEFRQLETLFDERSLGAKSRAVKRVAEMVMQEYVTRCAMQATGAINMLALFGILHDKSRVHIKA